MNEFVHWLSLLAMWACAVMGLFVVVPMFLHCCVAAMTRGYYETLFTTSTRHVEEMRRRQVSEGVNDLESKFKEKFSNG